MTARGPLYSVSSLETWVDTIVLYDDANNQAVNIATADDVIISLRDFRDGSIVLKASILTGEIVKAGDNLSATMTVPRSKMSVLDPKTYEVGMRVIWDADTNERQYVLGTIAVFRGL